MVTLTGEHKGEGVPSREEVGLAGKIHGLQVCVMSQRGMTGHEENWHKGYGEYWSEHSTFQVEDEKGTMKDDFQRWLERARQMRPESTGPSDLNGIPFIRVSNDRYAREATFEDRLTFEDRQLLKDMGILL